MIIKHFILTILACVCLQVMACGQEKNNPNTSCNEQNTSSDFHDNNTNQYSNEQLKNCILVLEDSNRENVLRFFDSNGNIKQEKNINEIIKYHPYYDIIKNLNNIEGVKPYTSGSFDLSKISKEEKKKLLGLLGSKLSKNQIEKIDNITFNLTFLCKKELLKIISFHYGISLFENNKMLFNEQKIIGLDVNDSIIYNFENKIAERIFLCGNDRWLFGRFNKFHDDEESESVGLVGPYFIITIPDGREYSINNFFGLPNNYTEELTTGNYEGQKIEFNTNEIFMSFLPFEEDKQHYKFYGYINIDEKIFQYAKIDISKVENLEEFKQKQILKASKTYKLTLQKQ